MNKTTICLLLCAACATSSPPERAKPGPEAKPSRADLDAAAAHAQELALKLARAQARASQAIASCPAAGTPASAEEIAWLGDTLMAERPVTWVAPADPRAVSVAALGRTLGAASSRPALAWSVRLYDAPAVETISFPPGTIGLSTGALKLAANEAELAALLSHEMAHLLGDVIPKRYASVKHNICVPALTVEAYRAEGLADQLPGDVREAGRFAEEFEGPPRRDGGLFQALVRGVAKMDLTFGPGRDAELEADRAAFELLVAAGYETTAFDDVLGRAGPIANHPPAEARTKALAALRAEKKPPKGKTPPLPKNLK